MLDVARINGTQVILQAKNEEEQIGFLHVTFGRAVLTCLQEERSLLSAQQNRVGISGAFGVLFVSVLLLSVSSSSPDKDDVVMM